MEIARKVLMGLAWLYVLGVVVQVFLAGYPLLGGGSSFDAHVGFGWSALHLSPVLLLIAAFIGKVPQRLLMVIGLFVVVAFLQPIWVSAFRGEILGSLHVVGALVVFTLAHYIAQQSTRLVKGTARV